MKRVEAHSLRTGEATTYLVPSAEASLAYSNHTIGTAYDRIERREIVGGLPLVWQPVEPDTNA